MKTQNKLLLILTLMCTLLPAELYAQNTDYTLGGKYDYPTGSGNYVLEIKVQGDGGWRLERYVGIGEPGADNTYGYVTQFYGEPGGIGFGENATCIFAIKIDDTVFYTYATSAPTGGIQLESSVVGAPVTDDAAQVEYLTKRYSPPSTYSDYSFHVDLTFRYDKNNPDYFTITADIDATTIPAGTPISLAYGFDTYVNTNDCAAAITFPDISHKATPDAADVQSLYMVGGINRTGDGSLMAFFTMGGRSFDRVYSASTENDPGYPGYVEGGVYDYFEHENQVGFGFFNYSASADNCVVVAYDNIPAGEVTTISTGLTFTTDLPAGLTYGIQQDDQFSTIPSKHKAVFMDKPSVYLHLILKNENTAPSLNVGFKVNMPNDPLDPPALDIITSDPILENLGSASTNHDATYYSATGVTMGSGVTKDILIPLSTAKYGEWTINYQNMTGMSNLMPMGSEPATLTVQTYVQYAQDGAANIAASETKNYTITLPSEVMADRDITVNLSVTGQTSSFLNLPSSVTIPKNSDHVILTVCALPGAADGDAVTITLIGTNYAPVITNPDHDEITLTVAPKIYYIPVNPHLMSKMILVEEP
ncbi:MAG: hypothetical protein LBI58_01165 [Tannerellaceae bacterium]|jgi:hypothetical protein|nr:hypothetical protein [Tannerellaceae bacterium]